MLWYVLGTLGILVLLGLVWLITGVSRGARRRDHAIMARLAPLLSRLDQGQTVTADEVAALAAAAELRVFLYQALAARDRASLVPVELTTPQKQAEAQLIYWMIHPNELRDPPARIEVVATLRRAVTGGEGAFFVMRYLMPAGHWAGDKWMLGVAGPYFEGQPPFSGRASAFSSSSNLEGDKTPEALVDEFIKIHRFREAEPRV